MLKRKEFSVPQGGFIGRGRGRGGGGGFSSSGGGGMGAPAKQESSNFGSSTGIVTLSPLTVPITNFMFVILTSCSLSD